MVSPNKVTRVSCLVRSCLIGGLLVSIVAGTSARAPAQGKRSRKAMKRALLKGKMIKAAAAAKPGAATPAKPGKPKTPDKKGKKDDKKKGTTVETIKRPDKPSKPADPKELKAKLDESGKVRLNFKGQQWADVLQWLADISELSLDWQEVPKKTIDLSTRRSYNIDEVRDLLNGLLFDRGFTMIRHGEVLKVVKVEKIDPGIVPRVSPEELATRDPHEFVKVSFRLDSLLATAAAEELKPMISPRGKLTALKKTNRLEAMDLVINLRTLYRVLEEEQSEQGQERLVFQFKLKFTRAVDIKEKLEALLGAEKKPSAPKTPQQQQQAMRMAQQRAQQQKGKKPAGTDKKASVNIVANERNNSLLVSAPIDKISIIRRAIDFLDKPADGVAFHQQLQRIHVYRLTGLDPETLVKTLYKQGNLDPLTHFDIDKPNNAVIAFASAMDHGKIKIMVDALDGTGRSLHVIKLRKKPADYVAGTLKHMIIGDDDKKNSSRRRYYGFYGYGSRNESNQKKDKFRVDADIENNQLLIWANDIERKLVDDFLVQLGELPPKGGKRSTRRVIEIAPGKQTEEMLRRLQQAWPRFAPNKLEIDPSLQPKEKTEEKKAEPQKASKRDTTAQHGPRKNPSQPGQSFVAVADELPGAEQSGVEQPFENLPTAAPFVRLAQLERETGNDKAADNPRKNAAERPRDPQTPPPITITRSLSGGLIIHSNDTRALDLIEEMMRELTPPEDDFILFKLKFADSWWISTRLEKYFEKDDKKNNNRGGYWDYYYGSRDNNKDDTRSLSKRKPLKFISEDDTNTILVQGGSPRQLATVKKLVAIWDIAPPTDTQSARKDKVIPIRYSKAKVIAETIKEVYRDLLSSNDKSLQSNNKNKDKKQVTSGNTYQTFIGPTGGDKKSKIGFKGLLSIGIDEVSNTLVVSAPDLLMKNIESMITQLDEAAKPSSTVQVLQVDRRINSALLRQRLAEVFAKRSQPGKPSGGQKPGENGAQPSNNGNRGQAGKK